MIIAGPGSGKTRVLTFRVAWMIQQGVDPFRILALTFTNKAAREMRERIEKLLGPHEAKNVKAGTFHSVFSRILRMESDKINYPSHFTIYDTADSKNLIRTIIKEQNYDNKLYNPDAVYSRISKLKNRLILPDEYLEKDEYLQADEIHRVPYFGSIYKTYQQRCHRSACMDFDDLLINTYRLFDRDKETLRRYQEKFLYLLVDEFQDTNPVQYSIVKKIAGLYRNICVVGDDAQSIYRFRGADIGNIHGFVRDFPEAKTFKLEKNYRSTKNIIKAANSVIRYNKKQIEKKIWTSNDDGDKIGILSSLTDSEETLNVVHSIFEQKNNNRLPNRDFAIFYRTNAQSRAFEEALRRYNIPYRIFGGTSFYQRKEIKDLLAYFNLVINNFNEEALLRVINYPSRGIGDTTVERLAAAANASNTPLWTIVEKTAEYNVNIPQGTKQRILSFAEMIRNFSSQSHLRDAYETAFEIANGSGLIKELYTDQTPEGISRYENVQELLNGIKEFTERLSGDSSPLPTLGEYLQEIALMTDADQESENNDYVSLMTLHSAKGLEFPYVYITGIEENLLPYRLSVDSAEEIEEERRLFYVGITRAERKLYFSFSQSRYNFGSLRFNEPSRFLHEIDPLCLAIPLDTGQDRVTVKETMPGYGTKSKVKINSMPQRKKLSKIPAGNGNYDGRNFQQGEEIVNVSEGTEVEHATFGRGKVITTEGNHSDRRATVLFDSAGRKVLLLRFARLKVVTPDGRTNGVN